LADRGFEWRASIVPDQPTERPQPGQPLRPLGKIDWFFTRGKRERTERIANVAKTLELDELLDRKPAALSGGQRQRVAMGRAMIREPNVFLFDEPLSNLDAKLRVQMRIEIRRLHQRLNATSVFVTHDQIEAMTLADRLVVMNEGRIEQVGAPADVYRRPSTHYVAGFIGSPAMNFFDARVVTADRVTFGRNAALGLPRNGNLPPAGNAVLAESVHLFDAESGTRIDAAN
jgi:ABC-type sugar transport system ATPase subunit